jgi:hypothetical protein
MLVFLAPDKARLEELRQGVRECLAWRSIEAEKETLNLDNFQTRQAETKRAQFDEVVNQRVAETYAWVLVPAQTATDPAMTWDETRVSGPDPLAARVSKKLRGDESLIVEYSGIRLRMDLDRIPLWQGDHVGLKQLWNHYSQYLYLPRLRDSRVLLQAVRSGLSLLTWDPDSFAYASAFDEATGRYGGLVAGQHASVVLDVASVLVKPGVAARQIAEEQGTARGEAGAGTTDGGEPRPGGHVVSIDGIDQAAPVPRRFYGRVSVEPVRMLRDLGEIADAIVSQLGRADASVTVTVEIEARAEGGFPDDVRRTVSENARTLKFDTHEFEE